MAEIITRTAASSAMLEARVARLRTNLHTSPQGRKMLLDLSPSGMLVADRNNVDFINQAIVDFTDWADFSQWPQSS
jgi:hypothetical protein